MKHLLTYAARKPYSTMHTFCQADMTNYVEKTT